MTDLTAAAAAIEADPRTHALRLAHALLRQRGLDPDVFLANDEATRELVNEIIGQVAEPMVDAIAKTLDDALTPPGALTH